MIELQLIYNQTTVKLQIALQHNYITPQHTYNYITLRNGKFVSTHTVYDEHYIRTYVRTYIQYS